MKIKELRRSKGFSQSDVAKKLGVTSQAVSKWETDSSLPEMTMLPDIASLFGVQIDDLYKILRAEPKNTRIYFYLLDNLIDDGRLREAREVLKESVQKNPDTLNDFYVVFIEEYENGFEATKEAYRKLVEKYPEDWSVLFSVANTFSHHEKYEEAIRYWQMTFDVI